MGSGAESAPAGILPRSGIKHDCVGVRPFGHHRLLTATKTGWRDAFDRSKRAALESTAEFWEEPPKHAPGDLGETGANFVGPLRHARQLQLQAKSDAANAP
jgi:hypothetical protein